jgi:hypothetical protein
MNPKDIVAAIGAGKPTDLQEFSPELLDLAIKELQETIRETRTDLQRHLESKAFLELADRVRSISKQLIIDGKYMCELSPLDEEMAELQKMQAKKRSVDEHIVRLAEERKREVLGADFDSFVEQLKVNVLNYNVLAALDTFEALVIWIDRE